MTETEAKEREALIKEDQKFVTLPPPDYSKMSNEDIRNRTKMFKIMFGKE